MIHPGPPPDTRVLCPRRVLLIEDNEQTVKLFGCYLRQAGFDVSTLRCGSQAEERASAFRPDAILLDILLPELDGWDVLAGLKANSATRHIPVVIVTVLDRQRTGFRLGAVDHLVKPVERFQLLQALDRCLIGQGAKGQ